MSEELSAEQIRELKQRLLGLQQELKQLLSATEEGTQPIDLGQP